MTRRVTLGGHQGGINSGVVTLTKPDTVRRDTGCSCSCSDTPAASGAPHGVAFDTRRTMYFCFLAAAARGAGSRTGGDLVPPRTDHSTQITHVDGATVRYSGEPARRMPRVDKSKAFSCATPCQLASMTNGGTFDASRVTPVLEQLCPCSLPDHPFLLDIGTAAAQSRPDIVNWLRGSTHPT